MFSEAMDLYRALDLNSNPMDSSHFEPEIRVPDPQRWFLGQANCTNNTMFFSDFLDQIVSDPEPEASRCWSRSQKTRCPELAPEPEIWVPAPQPWYAEDLQALSLLCDVRYSTRKKLSCDLFIYCYLTNVTEQQ